MLVESYENIIFEHLECEESVSDAIYFRFGHFGQIQNGHHPYKIGIIWDLMGVESWKHFLWIFECEEYISEVIF